MPLGPETSVQYLKGVGEKRAALYHKLGIKTVADLLRHYPRDYIDLSKPYRIREAPMHEICAVRAVLTYKSGENRIRNGLSVFKLRAADESGILELTVFNSKYTVDKLKLDEPYCFYGKVTGSLLRREMLAPQIYLSNSTGPSILPVYPMTSGLTSRMIQNNIKQAIAELGGLDDPVPAAVRGRRSLPGMWAALRDIHFPPDLKRAAAARERFVFEELLILCCALDTLRTNESQNAVPAMPPADLAPFYAALPFTPTTAQMRCIGEAAADMAGSRPMNRLIQGDVGSGKTLVAMGCVYFAARNGWQSAVMAPTGILAEQHFAVMREILEPLGLRVELLTGSSKASERSRIFAGLANGEIQLLVGTHALISEGVEFLRLGLVVTDEQHRFGVAQRARLSLKGVSAHVLVMSATPIPRTLALIIYGDLALSVLDEKPPGRQTVETLLIDSRKRERAIGFIRKTLDEGKQAYIVCSLIEQGEIDAGLHSAVEYAKALSEGELRGYSVGLLHGRMKAREKDDIMRRFKSGKLQVLVSTTVVEVGVDVPGAAVIMIENAERFGLSQLHQLRGRVGRAKDKSWCILVSDVRSGAVGSRLQAMKTESDGFRIAERDLEIRGPGDFFGKRQHGLPALRAADLAGNIDVMRTAKEDAARILMEDPSLLLPEHAPLKRETSAMLEAVGERPN